MKGKIGTSMSIVPNKNTGAWNHGSGKNVKRKFCSKCRKWVKAGERIRRYAGGYAHVSCKSMRRKVTPVSEREIPDNLKGLIK